MNLDLMYYLLQATYELGFFKNAFRWINIFSYSWWNNLFETIDIIRSFKTYEPEEIDEVKLKTLEIINALEELDKTNEKIKIYALNHTSHISLSFFEVNGGLLNTDVYVEQILSNLNVKMESTIRDYIKEINAKHFSLTIDRLGEFITIDQNFVDVINNQNCDKVSPESIYYRHRDNLRSII